MGGREQVRGRTPGLAIADPEWAAERIVGGLSSGEGLIHEVRDSNKDDPGVSDKRLLVTENEFANVIKVIDRQGNTLSPVLRKAWEGGELRTLAKTSPARCAGPHIAIIGHITASELQRYLTATEVANGLGNRHLFVCVRRSKLLPEGGTPDPDTIDACGREIGIAASFARQVLVVQRADDARELWRELYPRLSADRPGLVGSMAARCLARLSARDDLRASGPRTNDRGSALEGSGRVLGLRRGFAQACVRH